MAVSQGILEKVRESTPVRRSNKPSLDGKTVALVRCACTHEYQDGIYGVHVRVANKSMGGQDVGKYKCTACGRSGASVVAIKTKQGGE